MRPSFTLGLLSGFLLLSTPIHAKSSAKASVPNEAAAQQAEVAKASYLKKAAQGVQDLTNKLKVLEDQSRQGGAKTRAELDRRVQDANTKLTQAKEKLEELRTSSAGAWGTLKQSLEEALAKVKMDYQKAKSYFHHENKEQSKKKLEDR